MTTTNTETTTEALEAPWGDKHQESSSTEETTAARALRRSSETLGKAKAQLSSNANEFAEKAKESYESSKTRIGRSFKSNPLAYLAGTFAFGVALGATLPLLRKEKELISRNKEQLSKTKDSIKNKATAAANAAKEQAADALHEKGLDPQSLKESAQEVAEASVGAAEDAVRR